MQTLPKFGSTFAAVIVQQGIFCKIHDERNSPAVEFFAAANESIRDFADTVCEIVPARQNLAEAFCQISNYQGSVLANRPATIYPQLVPLSPAAHHQ